MHVSVQFLSTLTKAGVMTAVSHPSCDAVGALHRHKMSQKPQVLRTAWGDRSQAYHSFAIPTSKQLVF